MLLPSTDIITTKSIIVVVATPVSVEVVNSNHNHRDGQRQATAKKQLVIAVVSKQNTPANSWFIMSTETSQIRNCAISKQCV
jgi:hypothetical protein